MFSQDRSVRVAHSSVNTAFRLSLCTAFVLSFSLILASNVHAQAVVTPSVAEPSTTLDTAFANAIDTSGLEIDTTKVAVEDTTLAASGDDPISGSLQAANVMPSDSTAPTRKNSMFHFDVKESFKNARVNINGISYHFDRTNEHNERNWGVGLELPVTENSAWMVGYYHNSNWRPTTYAWYVKTPWKVGPVHFGWMAGMATGYAPHDNFTPIPVAGLAATIRNEKVGVNFVCLPPEVCAVNLTIKMW